MKDSVDDMKEGIFTGFSDENSCEIPVEFFTQLLPKLHSADEIKITLYALWHAWQNGASLGFTQFDIEQDKAFFKSLTSPLEDTIDIVVKQKALISAECKSIRKYFLNSPAGREAAKHFSQNNIFTVKTPGVGLQDRRSEIFNLYENNIGTITPMMAEELTEAEKVFPFAWIEQAIRIAVKNNIRRWRYVEAILQSWQQEGFNGENLTNREEDYRRYIRGEFSKYVQH